MTDEMPSLHNDTWKQVAMRLNEAFDLYRDAAPEFYMGVSKLMQIAGALEAYDRKLISEQEAA